jgi:capsid portal protein
MVLEASADEQSGSIDHSQPAPKIEMKPMISERQQEGLFQEYDEKNMQKVRQSFRLPPIYVGRAEDYTRASAVASMITAEGQVFAPERGLFDEFMNRHVLASHGTRFWRFKSLGPALADPDAISKMIETFDSTGALTPNLVIKIARKMLDIDIETITDEWGDFPFPILMEYARQGADLPGITDHIADLEALRQAEKPVGSTQNTSGATSIGSRKLRQDIIKSIGDGLAIYAEDLKEAVTVGLHDRAKAH